MKIFLAASCAVLVLWARPSFAGSEDEVKAILDRFVLAQNAHDIGSVRDLLVDSPTFLYVARGGPVWGREAALKRYEALYQGTWKLAPDNSGLKVVLLNDTTAQLLVPMLVSQGPAGQPVSEALFLIHLTLVRNATEWRIASVLPIPIPKTTAPGPAK